MRNCQRCTTGEVSWTDDTVRLIGGVHANLCPECLTEHDGVIRNHPLFQEAMNLDGRRDYLVSLARSEKPPKEKDWAEYYQDKAALELRLRDVSLEFVKPLPAKAKTY